MLRYPGLDEMSPSLLSSKHHLGEEFGGEESSRLPDFQFLGEESSRVPDLGKRNLPDSQTSRLSDLPQQVCRHKAFPWVGREQSPAKEYVMFSGTV